MTMRMYQYFNAIPINCKWSRHRWSSDPNSENAFPKEFLTKLDTSQDYSITLESAKEKLKMIFGSGNRGRT